jgi:hypothetical protein
MDNIKTILPANAIFRDEWVTDKKIFYLQRSGLGHYWPSMASKGGDRWYSSHLRDSNPFKTLAAAERFISKSMERFK